MRIVYNDNFIIVKMQKFSPMDCKNKTNCSGNIIYSIVSNFDLSDVYLVAFCRIKQRGEDKNKSNSFFANMFFKLYFMVISIIKRTTVWSTVTYFVIVLFVCLFVWYFLWSGFLLWNRYLSRSFLEVFCCCHICRSFILKRICKHIFNKAS